MHDMFGDNTELFNEIKFKSVSLVRIDGAESQQMAKH